jgi:hypothetical protein
VVRQELSVKRSNFHRFDAIRLTVRSYYLYTELTFSKELVFAERMPRHLQEKLLGQEQRFEQLERQSQAVQTSADVVKHEVLSFLSLVKSFII